MSSLTRAGGWGWDWVCDKPVSSGSHRAWDTDPTPGLGSPGGGLSRELPGAERALHRGRRVWAEPMGMFRQLPDAGRAPGVSKGQIFETSFAVLKYFCTDLLRAEYKALYTTLFPFENYEDSRLTLQKVRGKIAHDAAFRFPYVKIYLNVVAVITQI